MVGRVVSWEKCKSSGLGRSERWEGSEVARWKRWEDSKVARSEG